jgi:hypothetical protein
MEELTYMQLIHGLTSELQSIWSRTDFTISGTGSTTGHGTHLVALQEALFIRVSWLQVA